MRRFSIEMCESRVLIAVMSALIIAIPVSLISGCNLTSTPAYGAVKDTNIAAAEQATLSSLLNYDFSSDSAGQILIDRRGASQQVDAIIGVKALTARSQHRKDEDILGVKMVGDLFSWTLNDTLALIARYIAVNGEVPKSGVDLFVALNTPGSYDAFTTLMPTQRMVKYGPAINMATNMFYQTFSNPEWHPGGIYVEILEPLGESVFLHGSEKVHFGSAANPENTDGALYVKVFSAAEEQVLFEDYVTFECREFKAQDEE